VPAASVAIVWFLAAGWQLNQGLSYGVWDAILVLNMASLVPLAPVFRFAGFRLYSPTEAATGGRILQFGLRHILFPMVALSIAPAAARGAEILTWISVRNLWRDIQLWRLLIACLSAVSVCFAFWAAKWGCWRDNSRTVAASPNRGTDALRGCECPETRAAALYEPPFINLHAGGPDKLFAGKEKNPTTPVTACVRLCEDPSL
jgi:hypothetical protein